MYKKILFVTGVSIFAITADAGGRKAKVKTTVATAEAEVHADAARSAAAAGDDVGAAAAHARALAAAARVPGDMSAAAAQGHVAAAQGHAVAAAGLAAAIPGHVGDAEAAADAADAAAAAGGGGGALPDEGVVRGHHAAARAAARRIPDGHAARATADGHVARARAAVSGAFAAHIAGFAHAVPGVGIQKDNIDASRAAVKALFATANGPGAGHANLGGIAYVGKLLDQNVALANVIKAYLENLSRWNVPAAGNIPVYTGAQVAAAVPAVTALMGQLTANAAALRRVAEEYVGANADASRNAGIRRGELEAFAIQAADVDIRTQPFKGNAAAVKAKIEAILLPPAVV